MYLRVKRLPGRINRLCRLLWVGLLRQASRSTFMSSLSTALIGPYVANGWLKQEARDYKWESLTASSVHIFEHVGSSQGLRSDIQIRAKWRIYLYFETLIPGKWDYSILMLGTLHISRINGSIGQRACAAQEPKSFSPMQSPLWVHVQHLTRPYMEGL